MEVSDVRRRLRSAIDDAKKRSAERRTRVDDASRAWERLLPEVAVPTFHTMAGALTAEGHRFKVFTPGDAVRLSLERSAEEFVELSLDTQRDEPALMLRATHRRGRRMVSTERVVREGSQIAGVTQEDLVAAM